MSLIQELTPMSDKHYEMMLNRKGYIMKGIQGIKETKVYAPRRHVVNRKKLQQNEQNKLDNFVQNVELNKPQVAHTFFNQAVTGMKIATATTRKYLDLLVKKGRAECEWKKINHETQGVRTLKFYTVLK